MKTPTARIKEKATIVKLRVRTEAGEESRLGMFAEERTKSFIANPARFYPIPSEVASSRWGTFETRQAWDHREHTPSYAPHGQTDGIGGKWWMLCPSPWCTIHQTDKTQLTQDHLSKSTCTLRPCRGRYRGECGQRTDRHGGQMRPFKLWGVKARDNLIA